MFNRSLKLGFSLAEVLVTLAVIGVIASMTIPTLMNNINDAQYKTAYKKVFSEFNQATQLLISDAGGSLEGYFSNSNDLRDKYLSKMNTVKSCNGSVAANNCWHDPAKWYHLSGSARNEGAWPSVVLNNGSLAVFTLDAGNCKYTGYGLEHCGWSYIDVNGFKLPNTVGKDIFLVHITKNAIRPFGSEDNYQNACNTNPPSGSGWGCSAKYLYDN